MKTRFKVLIVILIAAGSFIAGSWVTFLGSRPDAMPERKVLHYVDPMNPALKFDSPGIAPCGMPLEPVYADNGGSDPRSFLPGTVHVSLEKQQLIGVRLITVEKAAWTHTVRVLGRVSPDETLVHRVNAAVNGWIEKALPVTTGSMVREDEMLATFYSLEYRNLFQNYFNLINVNKEGAAGAKAASRATQLSVGQMKQLRDAARDIGPAGEYAQLEYYRKNLFNFGMSAHQVEEMERTRTIPEFVEIRAPIAGFILSRNVFPGFRFDRGAEFYRIADLSRVWILADVFENEASYFKPGTVVRIELPYQKRNLFARISDVLPLFDPATRTLKVRLEADNPDYAMRPDMFVNVELPVSGPSAIIVPVGAVLDSGLKKTVFVDRGNGVFEPRQVETGRLLGERVEVARGLMPGEKIVVSGNFLLDSEARLLQSASATTGKMSRDPVCGMNIDEDRAGMEGHKREYRGKTYFFCSPSCRDDFGKQPEQYLKMASAPGGTPMPGSPAASTDHASHGPMGGSMQQGMKMATGAHQGMAMPAAQSRGVMPGMSDASPGAHEGTTMPAGQPYAAMQGMPAAPAGTQQGMAMPGMPETAPRDPKSKSQKNGVMASGSAAMEPGSMTMPMPQGAMPGMAPQPAMTGPGQGNMTMPAPQGADPMMSGKQPGAVAGDPAAMNLSEMNQQSPPFPDPDSGSAPLPGSQPGMTMPSDAPGKGPELPGAPGPAGPQMPGMPPGGKMPPSAVPGKGPGMPGAPGPGAQMPGMPPGGKMLPSAVPGKGPGMPGAPGPGAQMPGMPPGGKMLPSAVPGKGPGVPGAPGPGAQMPGMEPGGKMLPSAVPGKGPGLPGAPGPGAQMPGMEPGGKMLPSAVPGKGPGVPGAPMPGAQPGMTMPPAAPGKGTGSSVSPAQKAEPGTMPRESESISESQTEKTAPQSVRTRRTNPRLQRYRPQATMPQTAPEGAAPMPGPDAGKMQPPEAGASEMKP